MTPYESPYRELHPSFPQPNDGKAKVWRYLDLAKLISSLSSKKLWLCRIDRLADKFEGCVTRGVAEYVRDPATNQRVSELMASLRSCVYVNSWQLSEYESEGMWRLYCGDAQGVALQTTYEKLDASLPKAVLLGVVTYIDPENRDEPTHLNALTAFAQKRPEYSAEREVRVVSWRQAMLLREGVRVEDFPSDDAGVIGLDWDPMVAIEHVYVSPYAEEWYRGVVETVLAQFCAPLVDRMKWSRLKGAPR